jgi:hypothetical protein
MPSFLYVFTVLVVLFVPVTATTLAHIDPSDPTWMGGYWDDGDFDYAVDAIVDDTAVPPPPTAAADGPRRTTAARVEPLDVNRVARPVPSADSPRGPPVRLRLLA